MKRGHVPVNVGVRSLHRTRILRARLHRLLPVFPMSLKTPALVLAVSVATLATACGGSSETRPTATPEPTQAAPTAEPAVVLAADEARRVALHALPGYDDVDADYNGCMSDAGYYGLHHDVLPDAPVVLGQGQQLDLASDGMFAGVGSTVAFLERHNACKSDSGLLDFLEDNGQPAGGVTDEWLSRQNLRTIAAAACLERRGWEPSELKNESGLITIQPSVPEEEQQGFFRDQLDCFFEQPSEQSLAPQPAGTVSKSVPATHRWCLADMGWLAGPESAGSLINPNYVSVAFYVPEDQVTEFEGDFVKCGLWLGQMRRGS